MYALRCTRKLLDRAPVQVQQAAPEPTTLLGDWYANILFSRPQHLVLCLSERTLLPVVVPAKNFPALPHRLQLGLQEVLESLGIPGSLITAELDRMAAMHFAPTANRRVLGALNDFMYHFEVEHEMSPDSSLLDRALSLAEMPTKVLEYGSAGEATRELFSAVGTQRGIA